MSKCYVCGREMVKNENGSIKTKWGEYELEIKGITSYECECGERLFDLKDMEKIQEIASSLSESENREKPDVINVSDVADLLDVTNQTVYNMIRRGTLKAYKIGKEWKFNKKDILSIIQPEVLMAARSDVAGDDKKVIDKHLVEL